MSTTTVMAQRKEEIITRREKDPRVLCTKIIYMNNRSHTFDDAVRELVTDLVPQFLAEEMVTTWEVERIMKIR